MNSREPLLRRGFLFRTFLTLGILLGSWIPASGEVLVEHGSPMEYLANTSDPGIPLITWTQELFDDTLWPPGSWPSGVYGVGYETGSGAENLIQTSVPAGTYSIYTRSTFFISDVSAIQNLFLGIDYDDGAVAWINGTEVYRAPQMPPGDPSWNTSSALHESSNGAVPNYEPVQDISAAGLSAIHTGTNVLAVGVWNAPLPSSDLVLVPQLISNKPVAVSRGPYLQLGTPTSVRVRWRTDSPTDSRVQYGLSPTTLSSSVENPTVSSEHEILVDTLTPDTFYYYSVGNTTQVLAGGDSEHFFRTSPLPGTRRPVRIWAIGDSGTADANAAAVRDAYESYAGTTHTDVWLMLGDNAYSHGTDAQYQAAVFETYPDLLKQSVVWPTFGNHDGLSASSATESGPYYDIFSLPDSAQAGGLSSGTEAYYSFDFANIHLVCLNSHDVDRSPPPGGTMLNWLKLDLMNTVQDWIIAFWHHPPYSRGSHDSDNSPLEFQLIEMRENALPVLEQYGVDLVLTGHSHSYERSYLLDGHYGYSGTLTEAMKLDGGDGRIDGTGAYQKASPGPAAHEGAVYVVAGSSGLTSGGTLDHPAMFLSLNELGSVVLDVEGDRLQARFLDDSGTLRDYFTLVKNTGAPPQADFAASPTAGVAPLTVNFADLTSTNTAAWSWDLDGDTLEDSSDPAPVFIYGMTGMYDVSLSASNAAGSATETKTGFICVSAHAPDAVSNAAFSSDALTLSWDAVWGATAYDGVRGDLAMLGATGGDFATSLTACLEDDDSDFQLTDTDDPSPGNAFYYLVRSVDACGIAGTYDGSGPGQQGSRDPGVIASSQTCP